MKLQTIKRRVLIGILSAAATLASLAVDIPQAGAAYRSPMASNSENYYVNGDYENLDHPVSGAVSNYAYYTYTNYYWDSWCGCWQYNYENRYMVIRYSGSRWEIQEYGDYAGYVGSPILINSAPNGAIPSTGWTDLSSNASATVITSYELPDQLQILGTPYAFSNPSVVFTYSWNVGYYGYDQFASQIAQIWDTSGNGTYWYIYDYSVGYVYTWNEGTSLLPPQSGWREYSTGNPAPGVTICYVPCESPVTLVKDRGDNEPIGTTYVFTAGGGASPTGYAFSISGGTTWLVQQDSASTTWNWDTTGQLAGAKTIRVVAHDAGGNPVGDVVTQTVTLFKPSTLGVSITANKLSPQVRGTTVSFTYKAVGGTNPTKEFEALMRYPNGIWYPMMNYSTTSVWNWNSTGMPVGTYYLKVRSREAGYNLASQGEKTIPFALK